MLDPVFEFMKTHMNGEVKLFFNRSVGARMIYRFPGLDDLIQAFEDA